MSQPVTHDRLEQLLASTAFNGLDFVEVGNPETSLHVHFLNSVPLFQPPLPQPSIAPQDVKITGGEHITDIAVESIAWSSDSIGRPVMQLTVQPSGDFSTYTLSVSNAYIDRRFDHVEFSFKALCASPLDCQPPPHVCPPPAGEVPAIDYLAKDFLSFRKALSDFSAARHSDWSERSEADFGMMFMEALCSVADDLSYLQDRIGFEATLETATQRRSVVRHARLVDYEPRPALASTVLLQFDVPAGTTSIPPGVRVSATSPDGSVIDFETGTGLLDTTQSAVNALWNRGPAGGMRAYYWDDADRCLRAGATEAWIAGKDHSLVAGQALLIDTRAAVPADPPNREIVHLLFDGVDLNDPMFGKDVNHPLGNDVTHIVWGADEALQRDHDITRTSIAGNLVPATQGRRATDSFAIDSTPPAAPHMPLAIVRQGPPGADAPARYFWTLREAPLAFLPAPVSGDDPLPEIELLQQTAPVEPWIWKRSILNGLPSEKVFATEPMRMIRITDEPSDAPSFDIDGDNGSGRGQTIRFGTGDFGASPEPGNVFRVSYRIGGGAQGNVAADSITRVESPAFIGFAVTNPFPASGGADEEPNERVRRMAPQQFRAVQYRAVTPDDYSRAAETLDWVSRGGTTVRWTGSWLTIFTSADPKGNAAATVPQQIELARLLDRYRMAGRDVATPPPVYASLDITITVCAAPDAFRGDVAAGLLETLGPGKPSGFFNPDQFTFGTPLYRGALEAAVQSSRGVAGIVSVLVRRRGYQQTPRNMPDVLRVGAHEIVRVDNDPSFPENGSLTLHVRGGK